VVDAITWVISYNKISDAIIKCQGLEVLDIVSYDSLSISKSCGIFVIWRNDEIYNKIIEKNRDPEKNIMSEDIVLLPSSTSNET
jgi:hypothetical protein